ncbi:MAG: helix-turn-helix transcriptional regulator [Pseudomonadota bacterium]
MSKPVRRSAFRALLAENVRAARLERQWSQEMLAEAAGLTQVYISRIEAAKVAASVDTIESLTAAFKLDSAALLSRKAV